MEHIVDATDRPIGRIATEVAKVLMGKTSAHYTPNNPPMIKVIVENLDKAAIDERKLKSQTYQRFSGYPGGQKTMNMAYVIEKKGREEVLHLAVQRMLPNNTLRVKRMKNLTIRN